MIEPHEIPPLWRRLLLIARHWKTWRHARKVDACICVIWNTGAAFDTPQLGETWRQLDYLSEQLWRRVFELPPPPPLPAPPPPRLTAADSAAPTR